MSDRYAILLLIILCTGVLFLLFGDVICYPNQYLFGTKGDSIKNYFTFAWYVTYDSGLHFSGMNHPWGEHIVYTDNQPLFSVPLRLIQQYLLPLDKHIIGIINGLVFASMAASSVVLYFILRRCLLPAWFAIIGAILVMLLSPQHYVISQQFALTNTLVLPAIWLCIIRLFERPEKISRYIWFVVVMQAAGFIHPYFLPMGLLLFLGHWLWLVVQQWPVKRLNWPKWIALLLAGMLPLMLFNSWLALTDTITDRPASPVGFFEGKANLAGLFYPVHSLSARAAEALFQKSITPEANHAYLGLATFICLLLLALTGIGYLIRKEQYKILMPPLPRPLQMAVWAGLLILLFSMAIPFRFGLQHWLDYLPPLRQFRTLYRFAWGFYYVFAVAGIYLIYQGYRYLRFKKKTAFAYIWLTVMLLLWAADALMLLKPEAELLHENKLAHEFMGSADKVEEVLKKIDRSKNDFQMILPVPYFSTGAEKIGYNNWKGTMYQSMKVAYQTGLPISTAALGRTSTSQVLLRTQLLSSDSIQKDMLPLLHPSKPILVVVTDSAEKDYERRLVQKSDFLIRHKNVSYYELPISKLREVYSENSAAEKAAAIPNNVVYETFAKNPSEKWLFNKGAFSAVAGPAVLFNGALPEVIAGVSYQASVWVNATVLTGFANVWLEETDNLNQPVQRLRYDLRDATEIYKDWLRATIYFKLQHPQNRIRITVNGKNIIADELLIRPVNQPVYFYAEGKNNLVRNNYPAY